MNHKMQSKVVRKMQAKLNISDCDLVEKLNIHRSTVRQSRLRGGLKCFRASKHPNRNMKQQTMARNRNSEAVRLSADQTAWLHFEG